MLNAIIQVKKKHKDGFSNIFAYDGQVSYNNILKREFHALPILAKEYC